MHCCCVSHTDECGVILPGSAAVFPDSHGRLAILPPWSMPHTRLLPTAVANIKAYLCMQFGCNSHKCEDDENLTS